MRKLVIAQLIALSIIHPILSQERGLNLTKSPQTFNQARRVALVVGNSAYKEAPLLNPIHDARDMARALTDLGFEVIQKENLTRTEMINAIRTFGERISQAEVALFYYAGHGMQVDGHNWLIPVGANISREHEVEYESVDVGRVLDTMQDAKSPVNIVILDACRNNPFARSFRSASRGLAMMNAPTGTIIGYATAPGAVASDGDEKNGLYTQELLRAMRTGDLKIEDVFKQARIAIQRRTAGKQIPWESSSLVGDFFFLRIPITKITAPTDNTVLADPKLEGAYRFVGLTFQGGAQTDADSKGMIIIHGKYMEFLRASVGRPTWDQNEPQDERAKKMIAAYQGLAATAGTFEVQGNVISLQQVAQSSPASMGTTTKWEYKLEGNKLKLRPVANPGVEFTFERLP